MTCSLLAACQPRSLIIICLAINCSVLIFQFGTVQTERWINVCKFVLELLIIHCKKYFFSPLPTLPGCVWKSLYPNKHYTLTETVYCLTYNMGYIHKQCSKIWQSSCVITVNNRCHWILTKFLCFHQQNTAAVINLIRKFSWKSACFNVSS